MEDENFCAADVFITPPNDGAESAEDSGDEDECTDINKLSGDRFFSSLKLVNRLQEQDIGYTGTIKYNRIEKCSAIMSLKAMGKKPRGYYDFCTDQKNNVTITTWHDNRIVLTLVHATLQVPKVMWTDGYLPKRRKFLLLNHLLSLNITNIWEVSIEWIKMWSVTEYLLD